MTAVPDCAPIILFIYNRPEHTARALASLAANAPAADSDLIIYADGPKKPEQESSVCAARAVAREARGFKSVRMIERDRNLGLANSIIAGVTEVCDARGSAIVVEDDLIVSPGFLKFLNDGLERYVEDEKVFQISGYMYPGQYGKRDAFFLPMISCWGWATWKRAWVQYDDRMSGFARLAADESLRRRFNLNGAYDYFSMASQQRRGQLDSWGIRWHLSVFMQDGLVLHPPVSLVQNSGTDGTGTHGKGHAQLQRVLELDEIRAPDIQLPDSVVADEAKLQQVEILLRSMKPGVVRRAMSWLLH